MHWKINNELENELAYAAINDTMIILFIQIYCLNEK